MELEDFKIVLFIYNVNVQILMCFVLIYFRDVPIDVPDKYGFTGLMQASQKGYTEYVFCMLNGF